MLFNHNGVDFDIDERAISQEECIKLFTPIIGIAEKFVDVIEVNVEDDTYAVILIEGGDQNNYAEGTIDFVKELNAYNIDAALCDEDYGELDAVNIYMEE